MTDNTTTTTVRWTANQANRDHVLGSIGAAFTNAFGTMVDPTRKLGFVFNIVLDLDLDGFSVPLQGQTLIDRADDLWGAIPVDKYPTAEALIVEIQDKLKAKIEERKARQVENGKTAKQELDEHFGQPLQGQASAPPPANDKPKAEPEKPTAQPADLSGLAEAPFSATFKAYHKTFGVEVLITVRSATVKDGLKRLDVTLEHTLGENGNYTASRLVADPTGTRPSTANRRIGNEPETPAQSKPAAEPPPASSEIETPHVDKVDYVQFRMVNGKRYIDVWPVLGDGSKAKFAALSLKEREFPILATHMKIDSIMDGRQYAPPQPIEVVWAHGKEFAPGKRYKDLIAIRPSSAGASQTAGAR